ncbi:MAG: FAD-dependent oxidoreductase [Candidatus Marinimicrobia bacterium]|nr:FAD-dependent oxidoreductase [Candidatus Neomarinimicrobiota bacterium]
MKKEKQKIAIIGSGISSLTSAYILSREHDVYIFEQNDYIGGHTHTHEVKDKDKILNIDSGFIVYNENTYPNFINLLNQLGVERQHTQMGFSVKSQKKDFEYAGNSISSYFAQKTNLLKPSFLRMTYDILRFNKLSLNESYKIEDSQSLNDYLTSHKFSKVFIDNYIIPMGAAIWSTSPRLMLDMPASFFIRFFKNHGLLQITNRPQWWVIKNGSKQYVKEIIKPFKENIRINTKVDHIKRKNGKVNIYLNDNIEVFDSVVIGTHSDQALKLIKDPSVDEENILKKIKYQKNTATMHTDQSILPNRKLAWASWNYLINDNKDELVTLTYNMNILQTLNSNRTYCVTINNTHEIDKSKIIKEIIYHHPLYTIESVDAQNRKSMICGKNNTFFCGSYWGYGFHEDGVNSAIDVCSKFGLQL